MADMITVDTSGTWPPGMYSPQTLNGVKFLAHGGSVTVFRAPGRRQGALVKFAHAGDGFADSPAPGGRQGLGRALQLLGIDTHTGSGQLGAVELGGVSQHSLVPLPGDRLENFPDGIGDGHVAERLFAQFGQSGRYARLVIV